MFEAISLQLLTIREWQRESKVLLISLVRIYASVFLSTADFESSAKLRVDFQCRVIFTCVPAQNLRWQIK